MFGDFGGRIQYGPSLEPDVCHIGIAPRQLTRPTGLLWARGVGLVLSDAGVSKPLGQVRACGEVVRDVPIAEVADDRAEGARGLRMHEEG